MIGPHHIAIFPSMSKLFSCPSFREAKKTGKVWTTPPKIHKRSMDPLSLSNPSSTTKEMQLLAFNYGQHVKGFSPIVPAVSLNVELL